MADYIYLLENRLSAHQRAALRTIRELARSKALTVFLVGGAVRDLTSGSPVRDLDVVVQGNALKLKKDIEKAGGVITGDFEPGQSLFVRFPGNIRMEVGSTLSVTFPKPGKAVVKPATILDDLRRRDFTANAMALSLNEGSYGLLMDPLNGIADIENRELRLVSNYGFIDDPVRMIRGVRLMARLGWTFDEKTQTRYETGRAENYIDAMSAYQRGYETEEIVHEEDPIRVLKRLEFEGWMKYLAPYWTSSKVNAVEVDRLRDTLAQLQMQGIHPDTSAVQFPLITAKLTSSELNTMKSSFPRQGFVEEIIAIDADAKEFALLLGSKAAAAPSQAWKLILAAKPELVLAVAYSTKNAALQAKFNSFFTEWPQARQKMPYALMQEMRIVADLPEYEGLLEKLFFELMDGKLNTPEEMKAFLEPYSPPAPPPPVSLRRARAAKKDAKPAKIRTKKTTKVEAEGGDSLPAETVAPTITAATVPQPVVAKSTGKQIAKKPAVVVSTPTQSTSVKQVESKPMSVVTPKKTQTIVTAAGPTKNTHGSVAARKDSVIKHVNTVKTSVPAKKTVIKKTTAKAAPVLIKKLTIKPVAGKGKVIRAGAAISKPMKTVPKTLGKPVSKSVSRMVSKPIVKSGAKLTKKAVIPAKKVAVKVVAKPAVKKIGSARKDILAAAKRKPTKANVRTVSAKSGKKR